MSFVFLLAAVAVILCEATPMRRFKANPRADEHKRTAAVANARMGLAITLLSACERIILLFLFHTNTSFSGLDHWYHVGRIRIACILDDCQRHECGAVYSHSVRAHRFEKF